MDRFESAFERCVWELYFAVSKRVAYNTAIEHLTKDHPGNVTFVSRGFFDLAKHSLFNDFFSHQIKVLEGRKTAGFYYLYNMRPKIIDKHLKTNGISIDEVKELSEKLLIVRDKTHFHIDKKYVNNTELAWEEAGITGDFNNRIMDALYKAMHDAFYEVFNYKIEFSRFGNPFNGHGIEDMIDVLVEHGNITDY